MKKILLQDISIAFFAVTVAILGALLFSPAAHDAQAKGVFGVGSKTANATTSLQYMTAGTATTTLTYDAYKDGLSTADGLSLLLQLTASSTVTKVLVNEEYSQDGIDWYQASQPAIVGNATTTSTVSLQAVPVFSWQFASSSPGLPATPSNDNTDARMIPLSSHTRFVRVIITLPVGSSNAGIWAHLLPVKQNP